MSTNNSTSSGTKPTKRTLVEEGTELKGTMSSKCPIVVMGKVEGDISGPSIEVAEGGIVAGNVNVQELRSAGELSGHITADAVYLSGKVRDNTVIRATTLEVSITRNEGPMEVTFGGACELAIGDEPSKTDAEPVKTEPAKVEAKPESAPSKLDKGDKMDKQQVVTIPPVAEDANGASDGKRAKKLTQPPPSA